MRKMLIVDDEKNIRLGLKAMIAREFPDTYAFEFAGDGEEALALLASAGIDIVITDIRMPVMDGITLIHRIQELVPKPAVLILSGHDDFHFAKEAIRCEVKEYLLKPIVRDELSRTLLRLEKELKQKEQIQEQLSSSMQQRVAFQESQLSYLLRSSHLPEADLRSKLQGIEMQWLDEGFQIGVLQYRGTVQEMGHAEFLARIHAEIGNAPEWCRTRRAHVWDKENQLVLIAEHGELFQHLAERISGPGYFTYSMGLSAPARGVTRLQEAYQEAQQALKYTFLLSVPGVVRFEGISQKSRSFAPPTETIKKIANMLGTDRDKEMTALLMEVLDIKTVTRFDISYLEAVSRAFNEHVFDKVFHVYGGESVEILRLFKKVGDISNFNYFHDYFHSVEGLLHRLNDYVRSMKTFHIDHKEMKKAVQYMQENYRKDLNMAIVSNHVSLNYSYFSQAFKEYTGESFVNYLKKLRIDRARELLATTDYKVYEISKMAGFENTKHFSRVFKEMEGVSPQEYRDQRHVMG
ncbi:response regulator [Paenibacillus sedimenti]|uniref:Response regulator n=1 Tax=Paenibacillus sedimenti TaxID=2770274 RepID=A0A926KRH0_9BACL|nr:response regulator [Paenibacillus sedimenti]MBD0381963.1 response regulator [Paenibacillus sedimenti]